MTAAADAQTVVYMRANQSSADTTPRDCQVLVVGAGPTGLVLAADLLARGIHTRVIDLGNARQSMTGMPYRDLVQIVTLAPDGTHYPRSDGTSMVHLVRSDGFLAPRGTPDRVDAIHAYLRPGT